MSPGVLTSDVAEPGRRRRADAQRNLGAIITTATRLLADQPRTSMGQIAATAGVHRATVHRHFASREELVAAIRREAMDDALRAVRAVLADPPPRAADRLEALTAAMLASADRYRLFRFTTWRDEQTVERAAELEAVLLGLLAEGQAEGDLRSDVDAAALLIAYGGLVMATLPVIAAGAMDVVGAASFLRLMLSPPAC